MKTVMAFVITVLAMWGGAIIVAFLHDYLMLGKRRRAEVVRKDIIDGSLYFYVVDDDGGYGLVGVSDINTFNTVSPGDEITYCEMWLTSSMAISRRRQQ